jgi:hypothetical protein
MPMSIEESYAINQKMEITYGIKQLLKRGKRLTSHPFPQTGRGYPC